MADSKYGWGFPSHQLSTTLLRLSGAALILFLLLQSASLAAQGSRSYRTSLLLVRVGEESQLQMSGSTVILKIRLAPGVVSTCQYCGESFQPSDLTLDHVIPRSRGGNSTWENLVACCHSCNRQKGNRMLHEIDDMILLREPRPFSLHTSRQIMRMLGRGDDRWRKYLFY